MVPISAEILFQTHFMRLGFCVIPCKTQIWEKIPAGGAWSVQAGVLRHFGRAAGVLFCIFCCKRREIIL